MKKSKTSADYSKEAYSKEKLSYESYAEKLRLEKITTLVEGKNKKILDIGCYDGTLGNILIKNKNEVYGLEINKEVAEIAKKKGLRVKVQNIESGFGFKDNFFDVIIASEVIEHIADTDFFLNEIYKSLKKNGYLIISTPNVVSLGKRVLFLFGKNVGFDPSFKKPWAGHLRYYTKDSLINLLIEHNFKITNFSSDFVSFTPNGNYGSKLLANIIPTFGRILIVKCQK